jgi:hypothetical protein
MFGSRDTTPWRHRPEVDDPRRRGKRHVVDSLTCDLGEVLDLSTVGMRVGISGKPPLQIGQSGKIRLRIPEGALAVTGRVVWMRRTGFRRYQMGVEFVNVKRSVSVALDLLGRFGFLGVGSGGDEPPPEHHPRKRKSKVMASIDLPDYYAILEVAAGASDDEIRNAFRLQARKWHPDVSKDKGSENQFIQIHEAYEVLRDPNRRKQYDLKRAG